MTLQCRVLRSPTDSHLPRTVHCALWRSRSPGFIEFGSALPQVLCIKALRDDSWMIIAPTMSASQTASEIETKPAEPIHVEDEKGTLDPHVQLRKSRLDELSIPRTLWVFRRAVFFTLCVYTGFLCEGFEVSSLDDRHTGYSRLTQ
jgi:hypothetical protein